MKFLMVIAAMIAFPPFGAALLGILSVLFVLGLITSLYEGF